MKKTIYLVRGEKIESYESFKDRIFKLATFIVEVHNPISLKIVLTVEAPPLISIIPFKKSKIASISIVVEKSNYFEELISEKGFTGLYETTEALPVSYTKNWIDGEVTPGVCLLTLFNQKKSIDYKIFINRWHNSHTPLSLKIHPLAHYNRNVVNKNGENNVDNWDGIVEEHTQTRSELLNPMKFFGNSISMLRNMFSVYLDTKSFLDYNTIEPYLTQEYWIKS